MTLNEKISAAIITKGEDTLQRAINSVLPFVAEAVVLDTRPAAEPPLTLEGSVRIIRWEWQQDFGAARRELERHVQTPYYIWIDSDDELVADTEKFPKWLESITKTPNTVGNMLYHYRYNPEGFLEEMLIRERILPTGYGEWGPSIHEGYNLKKAVVAVLAPEGCYIKHDLVDDTDVCLEKAQRNKTMIERELLAHPENPDKRIVVHYAESLKICGEFERALKLLMRFQREETAGWPKSRIFISMAQTCICMGRYAEARQYACLALSEAPQNLTAIRTLFDLAIVEDKLREAEHWFKIGYESGISFSTDLTACSPAVMSPPYVQMALILARFGQVRAGLEYAKKTQNKEVIKELEDIVRKDDERRAAVTVSELVPDKRAFIATLSKELRYSPEFFPHDIEPVPVDKLSITIFCGGGPSWGPASLSKGLGGSETAVIRASRELAKLGAHVEVYGPFEGWSVDEGVYYIDQALYSERRSVDVFIGWRMPLMMDLAPKGARKILWLHDALDSQELAMCPAQRPDEIWCLSKYHAAKSVPADMRHLVWLTENGIPEGIVPGNKDGKRAVYCSSPDRGLDILLEWWPSIVEQLPDAELQVFYGFNETWMQMEKSDPKKKEFRLKLEKQLKETPGVRWVGKVGQQALHYALSRARVWLYPTEFDEISCISAKEAQKAGAYPVCSRFAALDETVTWGLKFGSADKPDIRAYKDEFIRAAVARLQIPSITTYEGTTWAQVARSWYDRQLGFKNERSDSESDFWGSSDDPAAEVGAALEPAAAAT